MPAVRPTPSPRRNPLITPPTNFQHISHVDRSDPVDALVEALCRPITPIDSLEQIPLPSRASQAASNGGSLPGRHSRFPSSSSTPATTPTAKGTVRSLNSPRPNLLDVSFPAPHAGYLRPASRSKSVSAASPFLEEFSPIGNYANISSSSASSAAYPGDYENFTDDVRALPSVATLPRRGGAPPRPPAPPSRSAKPPGTPPASSVVFRKPSGDVAPPPRQSRHDARQDARVSPPPVTLSIVVDRPGGLDSSRPLSKAPAPAAVPTMTLGLSAPAFTAPALPGATEKRQTKIERKHNNGATDDSGGYVTIAKKRPAPPPPTQEAAMENGAAALPKAAEKLAAPPETTAAPAPMPATRRPSAGASPPVPKPRTVKMNSTASVVATSPLELRPEQLASHAMNALPNTAEKVREVSKTLELKPEQLKLDPANSQLAAALAVSDDSETTRL